MRKRLKHRCILLASAVVIFLAATGARSTDRDAEVYTVVPEDTLWALAERFFSDPQRWTQIWAANNHIKDPHWIYPGDQLRIMLDSAVESAASRLGLTPKRSPASTYREPSAQPFRPTKWLTPAEVPEEDKGQSSYIDHLIDPDVPADTYFDSFARSLDSTGFWNSIDQSIELHGQYRKTTQNNGVLGDDSDSGTVDTGLHYIARRSTRNWGNFRLNLIALDESSRTANADSFINSSNNFSTPRQQSGLARLSLEQYNLPLTKNVSLNNIIGTHRQVRYNPFRDRPNLINYRFGAAEPDVLGISSQLLAGRTGLSVSAGRLGQSQGNLLPGFVKTSGDIRRVQATHVRERHAFTGDVWRTNNQKRIDDRAGYRLGYDHLLGDNTVLSLNAVRSGSKHALLAGGATKTDRAQHDFGGYFFEPDIIWLDQRIGDDNAGAFYRYQTRASTYNWGGSIEVRKDGLAEGAAQQSTSAYLSMNMAHRMSRRSTFNHVYNFRTVSYSESENKSINEHSIRSYYTTTHQSSARSSVSALARLRSDQEELMLGYSWSKELKNDSNIELTTNYRTQFNPSERTREWLLNTSWSKQFSYGTYLSAGLGYNFGRSSLDDNKGFTSFLNLEQTFGPNFSLSMQLDYSKEQTRYVDEEIADTFFTNNQFADNTNFGSRQFFALLSLRYQRGGEAAPVVLNGRGRSNGAGSVRGFVFVDSNNDGIRQATEPGVPGVTVFWTVFIQC